MKWILSCLPICAIVMAIWTCSAQAYLTVRQIGRNYLVGQQAQGVDLEVWAGQGLNLSFINVGEIIEKIWLDDPSQFVLDVDGCLEGLNQCSGRGIDTSSGAQVIHLRLIERLEFPHLPHSDSSLLTVVTRGILGRAIYTFRLSPGQGTAQYSVVSVIPAPMNISTGLQVEQLERGLAVAVSDNKISRDSALFAAVNQMIVFLRLGVPLTEAASRVELGREAIDKLLQLGEKPDRRGSQETLLVPSLIPGADWLSDWWNDW